MTEIEKETITTPESAGNQVVRAPTPQKATGSQTTEYLVYYIFGALEILLVFRFVLKLAGASLGNAFVGFVYGLSGIFVAPFAGIFHRGFTQGVETTSVFEPSTLIAILVYAVVAWGIVKLVRISSGEKQA
jgi:hypothetical protein